MRLLGQQKNWVRLAGLLFLMILSVTQAYGYGFALKNSTSFNITNVNPTSIVCTFGTVPAVPIPKNSTASIFLTKITDWCTNSSSHGFTFTLDASIVPGSNAYCSATVYNNSTIEISRNKNNPQFGPKPYTLTTVKGVSATDVKCGWSS